MGFNNMGLPISFWRHFFFRHGWLCIFLLIASESIFIWSDFDDSSLLSRLNDWSKGYISFIPMYVWSEKIFHGSGLIALYFSSVVITMPIKFLIFFWSKAAWSKRQAKRAPHLVGKNMWQATAGEPLFQGRFKNIMGTLAGFLMFSLGLFYGPPVDYATRASVTKPGVVGGGLTLLAAKYKLVFVFLINSVLLLSFLMLMFFARSLIGIFNCEEIKSPFHFPDD